MSKFYMIPHITVQEMSKVNESICLSGDLDGWQEGNVSNDGE